METLAVAIHSARAAWRFEITILDIAACRRAEQGMIDLEVLARHALGRETLFEALPHGAAIERQPLRQHRDRFFRCVHNIAGYALIDDLRHGAAPECEHRRSTGHGFDQGKSERLRPVDRKDKTKR